MTDATQTAAPLDINFLYWEDCPSHERALALLREVLDEMDINAHVRMTRVETDEDARRLQFPGSPTILVEGRDIQEAVGDVAGLTCRVYRRSDGRISPLPPREAIVEGIKMASHRHWHGH